MIPYDDRKFQKILDFYLFQCPVVFRSGKRVSVKAKTFADRGFDGSSYTRLLNAMRHQMPILFDPGRSAMFEEEKGEIAVLKQHSDLSKAASVFYAIRNGFAHNSFAIKKNGMYEFTSETAKIRASAETLLTWIRLVEKGPGGLK